MVKTYIAPDHSDVTCPSCGAEIKAKPSPRSRRIQCPKCREVVVLENPAEPATAKTERILAAPDAEKERSRTEALETRIAALEATVAALIAASPATDRTGEKKKLRWATAGATDPAQGNLPEMDQALAHNLGSVTARDITIRVPAGDLAAKERAGRFKEIFERAGWTVRGPEDSAMDSAEISLALGVPDLPVGKEAAETYLALKAAGFEPIPVLDTTLSDGTGSTALSLTLPGGKIRRPGRQN
jgi:hypothetical protein